MPIRIQNDLPAKAILERENIFVMDENRAMSQDIRPLEILILNLMPLKEDTELQLLRALSNTPLQVNCTFLMTSSHEATHTSSSHINKFYQYFDDIRKKSFDGMIITGAPIEHLEYEEVTRQRCLTARHRREVKHLLLCILARIRRRGKMDSLDLQSALVHLHRRFINSIAKERPILGKKPFILF